MRSKRCWWRRAWSRARNSPADVLRRPNRPRRLNRPMAARSIHSTVPRSSCASTRATNPASRLATASSRAISIPSITRACRATRGANAASSATTTAFLFFPIRTRTARAASRSTSIPWRSKPGSCGAPTRTSARRCTSIAGRTTSSAIAPPPNRPSSPLPKPPASVQPGLQPSLQLRHGRQNSRPRRPFQSRPPA